MGADRQSFRSIYFRFISNQTLFFGRYLLPLLPFLSLLGAAAVAELVRQFRLTPIAPLARNALIVALTLVAIGPPAYKSIDFNANAAKVWTTEQAYAWLMKEVPAGSNITMESRQILLPSTYDATYRAQLRLRPFEYFVDRGVQYLVASSQCYGPYLDKDGAQKYPAEYADYMRIFNADAGSGAVHAVSRASWPGAAHPETEHGDAVTLLAFAVLAVTAIDLAGRQIARRVAAAGAAGADAASRGRRARRPPRGGRGTGGVPFRLRSFGAFRRRRSAAMAGQAARQPGGTRPGSTVHRRPRAAIAARRRACRATASTTSPTCDRWRSTATSIS